MTRTVLLSVLLTKRGVVLAFVVGSAFLGAGFGFLPELLGGPDDGTGASADETTWPSDETAETADRRDRDVTTTDDGGTTSRNDGEATGQSDGRTGTANDGGTPPTATVATTASSEGTGNSADGATGGPTSDDETTSDDEPSAVGVVAETNATVSSLADYPTSSRRLNAVVNPPATASTAGGA